MPPTSPRTRKRSQTTCGLAEAVAREGGVREVLEVLDDLEPEPDERAVDEAVDRRVDLCGGDQHEQQEPERLERLLVDRAGDRRRPSGCASDWLPSFAIRSRSAVLAEIASVVAARLPHAKAAASMPNGSRSKRSSAWITSTRGTAQTIRSVIANSDDGGAAEMRSAMMPPAPRAPIESRKLNSQNAGGRGLRIVPRSFQLGAGHGCGQAHGRRPDLDRADHRRACRRRRRGRPRAGSRRSRRRAPRRP